MAQIIADALEGELDVVVVHKTRGSQGHPELAIGAVDETGQVYLGPYVQLLRISRDYLAAETAAQLDDPAYPSGDVYPDTPPNQPVTGRLVIVVDNGIAGTGASMIAALRAVRAKQTQAHRSRGRGSAPDPGAHGAGGR